MTLDKLYQIIEDRRRNMSADSYVAALFRKGNDRIIQKVGEEAIEVVIASKNKEKKNTIREVADLIFHILILLSSLEIPMSDVLKELERRNRKVKK